MAIDKAKYVVTTPGATGPAAGERPDVRRGYKKT